MATLKYWDGSAWQELLGGGGGGTLGGDSCVICQSGDDILAKYAEAKLLTPGGAPLSATNRATLVILPGTYPLSGDWNIDAEFVDVFGLGSVALNRGCIVAVTLTGAMVNAQANNVRITGIGSEVFAVEYSRSLQVFTNCTAGDHGLGSDYGTVSGTFTNCTGGDFSFGSSGIGSGTFTNCTAGRGGFQGDGGIASGIFTNCTGGDFSFGSSEASGTFTNCTGGDYSFGSGYTASGTFTNCTGGDSSFGGSGGTASGTFTNCDGGSDSIGGFGGTASGTFLRCTLTAGEFPPVTGSGKQRLCIDGNFQEINAG